MRSRVTLVVAVAVRLWAAATSRLVNALRRVWFEEQGWSRVWVSLGMAITMAGGGLIYYQTTQEQQGTARFWIDTTGGTCVRQDPADDYDNDGTECSSLNAAYGDAETQCGDDVLVKAGTYSSTQTISNNGNLSACGSRVVIAEAEGETVSFTSNVDINYPVAHLELRGFTITPNLGVGDQGATSCTTPAVDIYLADIDVDTFHMSCVNGVEWVGGDVGPGDACLGFDGEHPWIRENSGDWAGQNITLDGLAFHDFYQSVPQCGDDPHTECLLVTSIDGLIVRNSTFEHCDSTGALYVTELNGASPNGYCDNVLIENNFFYDNDGGSGPTIQDDCQVTFRFNSLASGAGINFENFTEGAGGDGCGTGGGNQPCDMFVHGNYGPVDAGCASMGASWEFRDNAWLNRQCHTSDLSVSSLEFLSDVSNLHLASGADAIDNGYATSYPSTDIDGDSRYLGSAPDAGADEKE